MTLTTTTATTVNLNFTEGEGGIVQQTYCQISANFRKLIVKFQQKSSANLLSYCSVQNVQFKILAE